MDLKYKNIVLSKEDLPNDDLLLVAEKCGLEVAIRLMNQLQGLTINIPRNALRKVVSRYIREQYNGRNAKQLALECQVSVRHVYGILRKERRGEG